MTIKPFLKAHTFFSIYNLVFVLLLFGEFYTFGGKHIWPLALCYFSFLIVYLIGFQLLKKSSIPASKFNFQVLVYPLIIVSLSLIGFHLITMGGSPAFESLEMMKTSEVNMHRKEIGIRANSIWRYISSMNIKAILPFTLLLLLITKRKIYWIVFFAGLFYTFSLMQKSHVLSFLMPVLLYSLFTKKWLFAFKYTVSIALIIVGLVFVSNPPLRGGENDLKEAPSNAIKVKEESALQKISSSLVKRVFILPGEMVGNWFEIIPEHKPFLSGTGYQSYCKITHQEYHDYNLELYPVIYPNYAKKGVQGSANAAHFMRGYSNFGNAGLIQSAIFLAIVFLVMNILFKNTGIETKLTLNLFPIFLLSSGSLTTILFSGGWGLVMVLFWIFKKEFDEKYE
ncbi:MAG: hypothetical protein CL855_07275 [Cryomorphaceae bacterium]|nr:hypothetical protein [Cryomorphaceae bacterium]